MPSSLRDEAVALAPAPYTPKSHVVKLAEILPPELRAEFVECINDHSIQAEGLRNALLARGYELPRTSIQHYRSTGKRLR